MSFFEPLPDPPPPEEREIRRRPWAGTSWDSVGQSIGLSVLLAKTEEVAVVVSGVVAYPRGFTFYVATMSRTGAESVAPARHADEPWGPDFLRLGLRFADGSKATNLDGRQQRDPQDETPILRTRGGGGNYAKWTYRCQCSPLPPPGPLGLVCEWPVHGISQIEHEIDGTVIREAGLAAAPIWPEDVDLPDVS